MVATIGGKFTRVEECLKTAENQLQSAKNWLACLVHTEQLPEFPLDNFEQRILGLLRTLRHVRETVIPYVATEYREAAEELGQRYGRRAEAHCQMYHLHAK